MTYQNPFSEYFSLRRIAMVLWLVMTLNGCMGTIAVNHHKKPGPVHERKVAFLFQHGTENVAFQCPNGVYSIAEGLTFGQWMGFLFSLTIYTPMTIQVTCAK